MLKKLNENKIFEEVYIAIVFLIATIGWYFKTQYGYASIAIISFVTILLFNDSKYLVPCGLAMIFSIGTGFTTNQSYGPLMFSVLFLAASFIAYIIRNGFNYKSLKSYKGLLALSILSFIPLLYHNTIKQGIIDGKLTSNDNALYFLYFGYMAYFLLYILFAVVLRKDSLRMTFKSIGYISLVLSIECALYVLTNGFVKAYRMGWGHCNEAGILILLGLPFLTLDLVKVNKIKGFILPTIKFLIAIVGVVCSTSRGTYLFGAVEILALLIYVFIVSKYKKLMLITALVVIALGLTFAQIKFGIPNLVNKVMDLVFVRGLSMDDRFRLYKEAIIVWKETPLTIMFGAGCVAELTKEGFEDINTFMVFHSTFFECLATLGIVGVLALGLHFFERYKQLKLLDKKEMFYILIGFIIVDLYGLIDNTYGMYYFMIPIVIIMAAFDSNRESLKGRCEDETNKINDSSIEYGI